MQKGKNRDGAPSLTMEEILAGLTAAIRVIGEEQPDLSTAEGAVC